MVCSCCRVRGDGNQIQPALDVLDRFGRAYALDHMARTTLRVRTMALIDRLEIEQAKLGIIEGNFAAVRYHLGDARAFVEAAAGAGCAEGRA